MPPPRSCRRRIPPRTPAHTPPPARPPPSPRSPKPEAKKPARRRRRKKKKHPKKPEPKKQVAKKKPTAPPRLIISINKVSQKMTVALDGDTIHRWKVSTGASGYETPSGNFRPFRMEREHYSKEWDDAPMPYSIFFTGEGHAVHGSYHIKSLGRRASHGCVRLHPDNAAKLFALVQKTGMSNTRVIVQGRLLLRRPDQRGLREEKKRFKKAGSFLNSLPD